MAEPAGSFARLMRIFGVERFCSLCGPLSQSFESHVPSKSHHVAVHDFVDNNLELSKELLWQEICVPGGRIRFNHLDGEVLALRHSREFEVNALVPEELPCAGSWVLVSGAASVPLSPNGGDTLQWPNTWSLRHWKERMESGFQKAEQILRANGIFHSGPCQICPGQAFYIEHLTGKKHFGEMARYFQIGHDLCLEHFWQRWVFSTAAIAFNHLDGSVRMVRRPDPPSFSASVHVADPSHHSRNKHSSTVSLARAEACQPCGAERQTFSAWLVANAVDCS